MAKVARIMNKIIYLFFVLIGMLALVSSTPQGTMVEYGFENWNISANESTNFTMYVYPGRNSIAGMQSSFIYDARYMSSAASRLPGGSPRRGFRCPQRRG